jgi:hypothetical protein
MNINSLDNPQFVAFCYKKYLTRQHDPFGFYKYLTYLNNNGSRKNLIKSITSSDEFKKLNK